MHTFIWRDVRLHGWKPAGDVIESNFDTPLSWMVDRIKDRGKTHKGEVVVQIICHGLPAYLQCCKGGVVHPTAGPGLTVNDLGSFKAIRGSIKRLELHACLVARIGSCYETGNHQVGDGNAFCFNLAQAIQAEVMASIHVQHYDPGTYADGTSHGGGLSPVPWNGRVFTWDKTGTIIKTEDFPYHDYFKPKPG